jgi:hypothetical protein
VEALTDFVRLRAHRFCPAVIDIFHREIKLVFVMLGICRTIPCRDRSEQLRASLFFVEEGHDSIIQEVGRGDRRLAIIVFGKRHFRIGVDDGLPIDTADPFHVADVERVLRAAIAGIFTSP